MGVGILAVGIMAATDIYYIRGVNGASYLSTLFPYVINRRSIGSVHFRSGVSTFSEERLTSFIEAIGAKNQRGKDYTYVRIE